MTVYYCRHCSVIRVIHIGYYHFTKFHFSSFWIVYCLRVFIVVLQELHVHCLLQCLLWLLWWLCWLVVVWVSCYVPIVMYGLRLFIVILQELHSLPNCLHAFWSELVVSVTSPSVVALLLLVSEIAKCIAWGCLLFYKNYIVYYNVYCYYCGMFIEKYVYTKFHRNWLLCEWVTWPYYVPIIM